MTQSSINSSLLYRQTDYSALKNQAEQAEEAIEALIEQIHILSERKNLEKEIADLSREDIKLKLETINSEKY